MTGIAAKEYNGREHSSLELLDSRPKEVANRQDLGRSLLAAHRAVLQVLETGLEIHALAGICASLRNSREHQAAVD